MIDLKQTLIETITENTKQTLLHHFIILFYLVVTFLVITMFMPSISIILGGLYLLLLFILLVINTRQINKNKKLLAYISNLDNQKRSKND